MRNIVPLVALAALVGCSNGKGDLWLVHVPAMTNYDCETDITENFVDAEPPTPDEPTEDWIFSQEADLSEGLVFAQIVDGKKKTAYLVMSDVVYPGVKDKDGYTFTWESTETSSDSAEFVPSEYMYEAAVQNKQVETITFTRNKDTKGLTGTYQVEDTVDESYTETDVWDAEVPVFTGQINNHTTQWLVGTGVTNEMETPDCEDDECMLQVVGTCSGSLDLVAEWVGYADEGVFAAIENAEQNAGI